VIIGDEPVSALDVSIQAQIINLLMDLKANFDLSLIIISHDLAVVEYICDRIVVMYLGKVMETAAYSDLYGRPNTPTPRPCFPPFPYPIPCARKNASSSKGTCPVRSTRLRLPVPYPLPRADGYMRQSGSRND
jgi:peptide/nickel transport system ATP-binding protein